MNHQDILSDPNWLPVGIGANKTVVFQKFEEGGVGESTFLDNRAKGITNEKVQIPAPAIVSFAKNLTRDKVINELFHISHVGSTLVAKVFDSVPDSISYREPTIFRDFVNKIYDFHTGANPFYAKEMPIFLNALYALFLRGSKKHLFIKQTSGNLALPFEIDEKAGGGIEVTRCDAYLYTSAKDFLSHAVKSQGLIGDSVASAPRRISYYNRLCTFRKIELAELKPLEKVALIWLVEMQKLRARSVRANHNNAINFDACIRDGGKEKIVNILCDAYDISEHRDAITNSPAWDTNSKNGKPFDVNARIEELNKNYLAHKIDIEKAISWIRKSCDENINFTSLTQDID
jgi:hypothetical protein